MWDILIGILKNDIWNAWVPGLTENLADSGMEGLDKFKILAALLVLQFWI